MTTEDKVLFEVRDNIGVITLNRPQQRNAQDIDLLRQLDAIWSRAAEDDEVKVIVLNANGPSGFTQPSTARIFMPIRWLPTIGRG